MLKEIGVNLYNALEYLGKYCAMSNCRECELCKSINDDGDAECILLTVRPCNLPIRRKYYINTEESTWKEEE